MWLIIVILLPLIGSFGGTSPGSPFGTSSGH